MPKARKKLETFILEVKSTNEELNKNSYFVDILISGFLKDSEQQIRGKDVRFEILEKTSTYIIGLLITSRRHNIPPKTNRRKKTVENIGLTSDEGLGYANVFIYEKARSILMYEVNKMGCYIDHFLEYIYKCYRDQDDEVKNFSLDIKPILSANGYTKVMGMTTYKSLEFHIANPAEILTAYKHKNDAVFSACSNAKSMHSDRAMVKYDVSLRGKPKHIHKSLASTPINTLVDRLMTLLRGPKGNNVEKIEVVGYEQDSEDNRLLPIDLVTDRYIKYITLDEPRENHDLLESQRLKEIKALYTKSKADFNKMFKDLG